ncbi:MAG: hypothetical protein QOF56_420 [Acidobacteriaceae bacterium]|jgi:hypothetical protein|nr:hypothetical protein [Acidobacteriaceae bacterium]
MGDNLMPNGLSSYIIDCFAIGPAHRLVDLG